MHVGVYMGICVYMCVNVYMCLYVWSICMYLWGGTYACEYERVWSTSVRKYMYKDLSDYVCVCFCSHWVLGGGPRDSWGLKALGDGETHVDAPPNQWPQPALRSSRVQGKFHPTWVLGWPHTSWTSQVRPPTPTPQITIRVTPIQLGLPSSSSWKPSDSDSHCMPGLDASLWAFTMSAL